MNKKIFATALFAIGVFVSSFASAANTYTNSVGALPTQSDNAIVGKGGTARTNDLFVTVGVTDTDIPADSEIIIRLPVGLNFSGTPTYKVTPAVTDQGLTLKDNTTFGDPTLGENVGLEMFDTDGDGGNDRALIVASAAADVGDTLTISINVTASANATVGVKNASIIVAGGLAVSVPTIEVIANVVTSVVSALDSELVTVDQTAQVDLDVSTPSFAVKIPKGTTNGKTVTFTPAGKVQWGSATATLTVNDVLTPVTGAPLSQTVGISTLTNTVTYVVTNAPTGGFTSDVVVGLVLDNASITAGSAIGNYGLTIAGDAGVSGTANLFAVKPNGSSAALSAASKITTIVAGSSAPQALGNIVITENFDQDAYTNTPNSSTITITAGTGLTFATSTPTITDGGAASIVSTTLTASNTVMNIVLGTNNGPTLTTTISGINATATSAAAGTLTVTVTGNAQYAPNSTFAVAKATPVGTVSVTGPKTLTNIGPDATTSTVTVTLKETTYGAITRSAFSTVTTTTGTETIQAFFSVAATSGAKVTAVTLTTTGSYPGGSAPTFNACVPESAGSSTYVCVVTAESTALVAGTDTVTVNVDVSGSSAMVGDTVALTFAGNAAVSGTVDVATVVEATEAKVSGAIKVVKEGLTTAQAASTLVITEKYLGALGTGAIRLIAPAGVVFALPYPTSPGGTPTYAADTFAPNDTLIFSTAGPATSPMTITMPNIIVASQVSGYIPFDLIDGDIDANAKAGITADSINLAYADKTLTALSASANAIAVNAGFSKSSITVKGGLMGSGYTVKSASTGTVTASIANVGGTQTLTVTGVAAGAANVTVTDELGASVVVAVTVNAGAAIPAAEKGPKGIGDRTGVSFSAGATSDGGNTFDTTFTVDDDVTIIAVANVDSTDQGSAGAIHVAVKADTAGGTTFSYVDEDGNFADWAIPALPGAAIVADSLGATYTVEVYSGQLAAGTYRIAIAYTTEGGALIYTGKAIVITVTE